jgi:plasmid stabilization system protein ParE
MKIKILKSFSLRLADQVEYIAKDKPNAARKFKTDILKQIKALNKMPYKNKPSIYFNDASIRDITFKGYTIVYRIKTTENVIEVFGFIKYKEKL